MMRWQTDGGYVTLSGDWLISVSNTEGTPARKKTSAWRLSKLSHWLVIEGSDGWTLTLQWGTPVRWEVSMVFARQGAAMGWVDEFVPDTDHGPRRPSYRTVRKPDGSLR